MTLVGVIVRAEKQPCARCGQPIAGGWLYLVGPPVKHVACPSPKGIHRERCPK